jgi:hypothetical protein
MGLDKISFTGTLLGSTAIPAGSARFGLVDGARQQETVVIGMAAAWADSAIQDAVKNYYKYGNVLGRSEFAGVVATSGQASLLQFTACTADSEASQICFQGLAPVLLAPGESVRRGQYLEPLAGGVSQGMFRVSNCGPVQAHQSYDNSAETGGALITGLILAGCEAEGLLYAAGPSDELTDTTDQMVYSISGSPMEYPLPPNSLRVGDRLRLTFGIVSGAGSAGAYTVIGYINGPGSGPLFTKTVTFTAAGEVIQGQIDLYISSLDPPVNNLSKSGMVAAGDIALATYGPVAPQTSVDPTIENKISLAATPSAIGDMTTLLFLSVEKL